MAPSETSVVHISSARSFQARRRANALPPTELGVLLEASAAGHPRAWDAIVQRFGGCVRAVARAHRLSVHDTEDVVQATWLRLFQNIGDIRDPERLGGWLQTTARRECLRLLRSTGREQPAVSEVFEREAVSDDTERRLVESERVVALDTALGTLPARHRRLMRLLLSEPEPSYAEVSRELDIPIGSIGPTRGRVLARLRRHPALGNAR